MVRLGRCAASQTLNGSISCVESTTFSAASTVRTTPVIWGNRTLPVSLVRLQNDDAVWLLTVGRHGKKGEKQASRQGMKWQDLAYLFSVNSGHPRRTPLTRQRNVSYDARLCGRLFSAMVTRTIFSHARGFNHVLFLRWTAKADVMPSYAFRSACPTMSILFIVVSIRL